MSTNDERVERVARAMFGGFEPAYDAIGEDYTFEDFWSDKNGMVTDEETFSFTRPLIERMARAAVAVLNEEPTLEDVLREARAYKAGCILDPDTGEWLATVNCLTSQPVAGGGVGANPDTAIRAAVANAKGGAT